MCGVCTPLHAMLPLATLLQISDEGLGDVLKSIVGKLYFQSPMMLTS